MSEAPLESSSLHFLSRPTCVAEAVRYRCRGRTILPPNISTGRRAIHWARS